MTKSVPAETKLRILRCKSLLSINLATRCPSQSGVEGLKPDDLPNLKRPPLPPTIVPGDDEGTHGYIMSEFVESILKDRTPLVNIACALNMNVAGIVAHDSALKDGETLKVPQFAMPLDT